MRSQASARLRPARPIRVQLARRPVRDAAGAAGAAAGARSISTSATARAAAAAGGRGGGRRRMFESGELRLVLLKLIADEPRHGYDLIRAIEELTGGEYAPSPGVVYPTLTMLQDMGLIEEAAGEGARKPSRRPTRAARISRRRPRRSRRCSSGSRSSRQKERTRRAGDRPRGQESDDRAQPPRRPRRVRRRAAARDRRDPRRSRAADRTGEISLAARSSAPAARACSIDPR